VINDQEERYFVSESLKDTLRPEMLEETPKHSKSLSLFIGEKFHVLQSLQEDPASLVATFTCQDEDLGPVLEMAGENLKICAGNSHISRDLSGHELTWNIFRLDDAKCRVVLTFTKTEKRVING